MQPIVIYDTTLRDGAQSEDLNLTTADKVKIALRLDELGIPFIEGGWPGSNPVDTAFFQEIASYDLKNSAIAAFGATHHPAGNAESDKNLAALLAAKTKCVAIVGKTWEKAAPRESAAENVRHWQGSLNELADVIEAEVGGGDLLVVKGSRGNKLDLLVDRLRGEKEK